MPSHYMIAIFNAHIQKSFHAIANKSLENRFYWGPNTSVWTVKEPLCCEAGGEMERMIENAIYRNQTSGTYIQW